LDLGIRGLDLGIRGLDVSSGSLGASRIDETRGRVDARTQKKTCWCNEGSGGALPPPSAWGDRPVRSAGGVLLGVGVGEYDVVPVETVSVGLAYFLGGSVPVGALAVLIAIEDRRGPG